MVFDIRQEYEAAPGFQAALRILSLASLISRLVYAEHDTHSSMVDLRVRV